MLLKGVLTELLVSTSASAPSALYKRSPTAFRPRAAGALPITEWRYLIQLDESQACLDACLRTTPIPSAVLTHYSYYNDRGGETYIGYRTRENEIACEPQDGEARTGGRGAGGISSRALVKKVRMTYVRAYSCTHTSRTCHITGDDNRSRVVMRRSGSTTSDGRRGLVWNRRHSPRGTCTGIRALTNQFSFGSQFVRKCGQLKQCCARGRPIIVEWERDARHSAGLSLVRAEPLKRNLNVGTRLHNGESFINIAGERRWTAVGRRALDGRGRQNDYAQLK
ncbi:hypothetical protein EVAR_79129_1 [Eumeta japonica]|uniref:Uncharacterized protein n=1 Tax=Eumeta variegata TaxID=151549 RepID=A0A4C1UTN2_EUMVA|nr:hypothetical protein EVAR_79129_1 [Eumeta japonica]